MTSWQTVKQYHAAAATVPDAAAAAAPIAAAAAAVNGAAYSWPAAVHSSSIISPSHSCARSVQQLRPLSLSLSPNRLNGLAFTRVDFLSLSLPSLCHP